MQVRFYMNNLTSRRWTIFLIVVSLYILSFFHRTAPAALYKELTLAFTTSQVSLGVLGAVYYYLYLVLQIPTGVMVDTFGSRKILIFSGIIAGLGSILFGFAPTLSFAIAGRALVGLGVSVVFISLLKLNSHWFKPRDFATLTGLTVLLGNLGAVCSAKPLAFLITVFSWRHIFFALGTISIILSLLTFLFVRNHPYNFQNKNPLHSPESLQTYWLINLLKVCRNPHVWIGFILITGSGGGYLAFAGLWGVPFLTDHFGFSYSTAVNHTTLMLLGTALGALVIGIVSDRTRKRRVPAMITQAIYSVFWIVMFLDTAPPAVISYPLFFVAGFCCAGFTLSWTTARDNAPHHLSGTAMSLVNCGAFIGAGALQPLFGLLITEASGQLCYINGIVLLFVVTLISLTSCLFIKDPG